MFVKFGFIRPFERGLLFDRGAFVRVMRPGRYVLLDLLGRLEVRAASTRDPWLPERDLDLVVRSGALGNDAVVIELGDAERALVTIDGRASRVLGPGLYALWTVSRDVRVDRFDVREPVLGGEVVTALSRAAGSAEALEFAEVAASTVGLVFVDGRLVRELAPGAYAWWRGTGRVRVFPIDRREQALDVAGQEIMTADRVTLRLNALVSYRVADPLLAVTAVDDPKQALYRAAQLALRAVVGSKELDALLADKDGVAAELDRAVRERVAPFGIEVVVLGIRDVILPGDMRELLNGVTAAKKAAEASLITRREETAAARSQSNTARVYESSPSLMRLRELEVLEKIAANRKLTVVVGDGGLKDRVLKLL